MRSKILLSLFLISISFLGLGQNLNVLEKRVEPYPSWILFLIIGGIVLVSIAKLIKNTIFSSLYTAVLSNHSLTQTIKDGLTPMNNGGILLLLNYFLLTCVAGYLVVLKYDLPTIVVFAVPIYFVFILTSLSLVGLITGVFKKIQENFFNQFFFHQFLGLLLVPFLLVWVLNYQYFDLLVYLFISLLAVTQIYRWFRGFVFAIEQGIPWYYFILYLCTLEILPIVALVAYIG